MTCYGVLPCQIMIDCLGSDGIDYVPLILLSMTTSMRFFDQCPANEDLLAILLQTPSFSYTKSVGLRHFILFEALRC